MSVTTSAAKTNSVRFKNIKNVQMMIEDYSISLREHPDLPGYYSLISYSEDGDFPNSIEEFRVPLEIAQQMPSFDPEEYDIENQTYRGYIENIFEILCFELEDGETLFVYNVGFEHYYGSDNLELFAQATIYKNTGEVDSFSLTEDLPRLYASDFFPK